MPRINRTRWLTLAGALLATMAVGAAGFWAGRTTTGESSETPADPGPSPLTTDFDFDGPGFCFVPIPGLLDDGKLNPHLGGFEARWLKDGFALSGFEFGASCHDPLGRARALKTNWTTDDGAWNIMLTQGEASTTGAAYRTPSSMGFWSEGYQFWVMGVDARGGMPASTDPQLASLQPVLDAVLEQLAPDFRTECFDRSVAKDWPDLAAYGIGDPRPLIPEEIVPIRLEFTAREAPLPDCPASQTPAGPEFQLSAMFTDRYDNLFSINISEGPPNGPGSTATFQPGSAAWSSSGKHFWLNWRPGLVADDTIRAIARALDPTYDTLCTVRTRQLRVSEIEAAGFRVPTPPEGFSHLGGNTERAFAIEPAEQCAPGTEHGFFGDWMLSTPDIPGFIQVVVRRGPQDPQRMPQPYDESRMIYWKDASGAEYWVAGAKAIFEREVLLEFARGVDPNFDESQLSAPPPP